MSIFTFLLSWGLIFLTRKRTFINIRDRGLQPSNHYQVLFQNSIISALKIIFQLQNMIFIYYHFYNFSSKNPLELNLPYKSTCLCISFPLHWKKLNRKSKIFRQKVQRLVKFYFSHTYIIKKFRKFSQKSGLFHLF